MVERRHFSAGLEGRNLRSLGAAAKASPEHPASVGYLLLEHFSLPAFTQSLDTLVTANLLQPGTVLSRTFSLSGDTVTSDLGLVVQPDAKLDADTFAGLGLLIICGGLRTPLVPGEGLLPLLQAAAQAGVALGGLWNGIWFIARAGLLDGYRATIHPEHRPALQELSRTTQVTDDGHVIDRDRLSAASPNGAVHMTLAWLEQRVERVVLDGVKDILVLEAAQHRRGNTSSQVLLSKPLREVVNLMTANIEEPLDIDQLAEYAQRSRRQIERLFHAELGTSPNRYYLELRITEARRLLQYSELSMLEVSVACGFVSPSHFSKCYSAYFGYGPSREIRFAK